MLDRDYITNELRRSVRELTEHDAVKTLAEIREAKTDILGDGWKEFLTHTASAYVSDSGNTFTLRRMKRLCV
jgi:hypothetical protein